MEGFFMQLWDTSIQTGLVICVVLLVRLAFTLGKVPKRFSYALWAIPFLRMLLPWQPESAFSMMPQKAVSAGSDTMERAVIYAGRLQTSAGLQQAAGTGTGAGMTEAGNGAMMQLGIVLAGAVWLVGILLLFTYSAVSYWKLKKRLVCSIRLEDNIYLADGIATPFVLGVFRPCIYLPSDIQENELAYVAAHERTHIRRKDHIIKILAFLVTCIYWFHPMVWLAFALMGRDMELSCDEAVMQQFGEGCKREYASVLLALSGGKRRISGVPLAFSEGNTKGRITNILKYKKPVLFGAAAGAVVLVLLAVGLLTNPKSECLLSEVEDGMLTIPEKDSFDHIEVYRDGVSTEFPQAYNEIFTEYLKKIKVKRQPVSTVRSEDRPQDIRIVFADTSYRLYLDAGGTEIWCDDGVKPSLSYRIIDGSQSGGEAENLRAFLDRQLGSITAAEEEAKQQEEMKRLLEAEEKARQQEEMESLLAEERAELSTENEGIENGDMAEQLLDSGLYGMEVEQGTLTPTGMTVILYNKSDQTVDCSDDFHLKRLEGEEWVDVLYVIDNWAFNQPAYIIGKDGLSMNVDWEWLYGELPAGTYLFTKTISIQEENGSYSNAELGTMFALEE